MVPVCFGSFSSAYTEFYFRLFSIIQSLFCAVHEINRSIWCPSESVSSGIQNLTYSSEFGGQLLEEQLFGGHDCSSLCQRNCIDLEQNFFNPAAIKRFFYRRHCFEAWGGTSEYTKALDKSPTFKAAVSIQSHPFRSREDHRQTNIESYRFFYTENSVAVMVASVILTMDSINTVIEGTIENN